MTRGLVKVQIITPDGRGFAPAEFAREVNDVDFRSQAETEVPRQR
jgi:hypothetical protein